MSRHQTVGQNDYIKVADKFFKNVAKLKNLGRTLTNQNCIPEDIKSRINSGNACYHAVQNPLSSRLISKNVTIKIYKSIILRVVLYGCEIWSITLREEHRLKCLRASCSGEYLDLRGMKLWEGWRKSA
jgi:hypothetical protein